MREERGSSNINYLPSSWDLGAILLPADCLIFNKHPISTKLNCVYYSLNTELGETSPQIIGGKTNRKLFIKDFLFPYRTLVSGQES